MRCCPSRRGAPPGGEIVPTASSWHEPAAAPGRDRSPARTAPGRAGAVRLPFPRHPGPRVRCRGRIRYRNPSTAARVDPASLRSAGTRAALFRGLFPGRQEFPCMGFLYPGDETFHTLGRSRLRRVVDFLRAPERFSNPPGIRRRAPNGLMARAKASQSLKSSASNSCIITYGTNRLAIDQSVAQWLHWMLSRQRVLDGPSPSRETEVTMPVRVRAMLCEPVAWKAVVVDHRRHDPTRCLRGGALTISVPRGRPRLDSTPRRSRWRACAQQTRAHHRPSEIARGEDAEQRIDEGFLGQALDVDQQPGHRNCSPLRRGSQPGRPPKWFFSHNWPRL